MSSILDDVVEKDFSFFLSNNEKKSKYPFDTVKLKHGFDIPPDVSIQTMRVTVSKWHSENKASGKRFKVFAENRSVVRIK